MRSALIGTTLAGWVVLDCLARHRAAHGRPKTRIEADQGSALFAQTTGMGSLVLGLLLARWLPSLALPGATWTWAATGLPLAWAGIALRIRSVTTLGAMFNPLVAIHDDHVVVEHGPYRFLRHPSYAGVLLLWIGVGIATANAAALVAIVSLRLAGYVRRITVEETALAAALGEAYTRYAQGRSRLVPGLW
jgi:protein-S-isoprenylcysteine O-methyltransferase Ste14